MTGPAENDRTNSILRIAEQERDQAATTLANHQATCRIADCDACASMDAHATRTERQVRLLTPPEVIEESLFDL